MEFAREAWDKRRVLLQLARQDFRNRYTGSLLGFAWTILQPMAMVAVLWLVFTGPIKIPMRQETPFALWLIVGMAAWNFFAEALVLSTCVFHEYSFLVKKVKFRIAMLPMVKILSSLAIHAIFMAIVLAVLLLRGVAPNLFWLQTLYYSFALVALLLAAGWITSSLNVFMRDIGHIVAVLLQFGFWLTPIVWDAAMLGPAYSRYAGILKLNPMNYIVCGYRNSLLLRRPFWCDPWDAACFWFVTALLMLAGAIIFRRLKPHFADVL